MISVFVVGSLLILVGNGIVVRGLLHIADSIFLHADGLVDEGIKQPTIPPATGSPKSLIGWDSIGLAGKILLPADQRRNKSVSFGVA